MEFISIFLTFIVTLHMALAKQEIEDKIVIVSEDELAPEAGEISLRPRPPPIKVPPIKIPPIKPPRPIPTTSRPRDDIDYQAEDLSQVLIDTESDIPSNGHWEFNCTNGYAQSTTEYYNCTNGGPVNLPPEEWSGEQGFWTQCTGECIIRYQVQPEDQYFDLSVYQSNLGLVLTVDGKEWPTCSSCKGWKDFEIDLKNQNVKIISLRLNHRSPNDFVLLDYITVEKLN